jgi:hypothetical protein
MDHSPCVPSASSPPAAPRLQVLLHFTFPIGGCLLPLCSIWWLVAALEGLENSWAAAAGTAPAELYPAARPTQAPAPPQCIDMTHWALKSALPLTAR